MGFIFEKSILLKNQAETFYAQADILDEIDSDISEALESIEEGRPADPDTLVETFRRAGKLPTDLLELELRELVPAHQALIAAKEKAERKGAA